MSDYLDQVHVNMSKRRITLIDDDGVVKHVDWKWDDEGADGFNDTVQVIKTICDPDMVTYLYT